MFAKPPNYYVSACGISALPFAFHRCSSLFNVRCSCVIQRSSVLCGTLRNILATLHPLCLICSRLILALACRRYLHTLYKDLRSLSGSRSPGTVTRAESIELDGLPSPVTSPKSAEMSIGSRIDTRNLAAMFSSSSNWLATGSRMTFALCFSESCVLFSLVIFEALGVFDEQ